MSSLGLKLGYIIVIYLSFPTYFRDKLWVGLEVGIGLKQNFQTGMLFQINK